MNSTYLNKIKLLLTIPLLLVFIACSDDDDSGSNNKEVNVDFGTYYPTMTDTYWDYTYTITNPITMDETVVNYTTRTDGTEMFLGKEWVKLTFSLHASINGIL